MFCDQTNRSKLATRQPNRRAVGIVSLPISGRWRVSNPVLIAVTAVVGLMA